MNLFNAKGVVFAVNCYIAAMLALFIAMGFNLPNPWWAALTVFITSQPLVAVTGAVWSRALYRVAGTFAGLAAALLIIPNLVNTPEWMMLAIAGWIALCVYLSLLDRTPRAYAFMLAGYTAALVGLPLVSAPGAIFDTAIVRMEEIGIGALCAAVVHSLVLPRRAGDLLSARLKSTLVDAQRWIVGALGSEKAAAADAAARRRLAADFTELNALARTMGFETTTAHATNGIVEALEEHLVALLPLLSAVEDRLHALRAHGPLAPQYQSLVDDIRAWIENGDADHARGQALVNACRAAAPEAAATASWADLVALNLSARLTELVQAWGNVLLLSNAMRDASLRRSEAVTALTAQHRARSLHIDHGLAAFSGLAAGLAVLATAGFALAMNWTQGVAAIGITAAGSSVFAFADDPSPFQKLFIKATMVAVPVAAFYLFAVFPLLDGFAMLALALFPLFMLTGLLLATPKYWLHGLGFALVSQTLLAVQPVAQADFINFLGVAIAAVTGSISALLVTLLIRVVRADVITRRILRAGWRDLARLALVARPLVRHDWASRMLDRQALLLPRLARLAPDDSLRAADALNDLRQGVNIAGLRAAAKDSAPVVRAAVGSLLGQLAAHYRTLTRHGHRAAPASLLASVNAAIRALLASSATTLRTQSLVAATGLRRGLFPDAANFQPPPIDKATP
jgi:uncharacterized membrane protein YccC